MFAIVQSSAAVHECGWTVISTHTDRAKAECSLLLDLTGPALANVRMPAMHRIVTVADDVVVGAWYPHHHTFTR